MDDTEMDIVLRAVDDASDTFEQVQSAAEDMGESVQSGAEQGSEGLDEMEASGENAADPLEQISTIIGGLAGAEIFGQLADALWDVADKAGTFEDSLMRARLEAEGAGIDVNAMTDAVSELSATTGRAGGEIRESFIKATARGITDLGSFKQMMIGAGAQATLLGTDIGTMADKMSGLAMRSSVMEKTLANTGITVEELGEALGIQGATIDDINEKWATLDTNQKAAALGMAASMNEGQTANEEYKKSWAGLQAQIDIAKGRLERLAGEVLLPVLVPALQVAARVLNFLGDTISAVMSGPLGGLISVIGALVAGFALVVPAVAAVQGAMVLYEASLLPAITATWALLSPWLPFIAIGAAIVAIIYEIGKAFGWWTDASSAIDAIWAGIQRLWSAFINHPDVQAIIGAIRMAWVALQPAIFSVIRLVMSFFTNTDGSKFDAVRAFIDAVGMAWKATTAPIRLVITVVKLFMSTMKTVYNNVRNIINNIKSLWQRLPGLIRSAISSLVSIITSPFRNAYNGVVSAVDRIKSYVQGLTNISLSSITDKIVAPFRNAYNRVAQEVDKIKRKANELSGGLLGAIGFGFDYEGMMEELEQARKTQSYNVEEGEISIKQEIDFNFDFTGLPEGINEDQLVYLLKEAINDKGVINQLVNNPDFQSLDQKVKNRLALKSNRARGV